MKDIRLPQCMTVGDDEYKSIRPYISIYLDGERMKGVVSYDAIKGEIRHFKKDGDFYAYENHDPVILVSLGKVEVRWNESAPVKTLVMCNDCPEALFSTKKLADYFISKQPTQDDNRRKFFWRAYEFLVDSELTEEEIEEHGD